MYGVIGITGQVGGAVARHLLAQGKGVKALVRTEAKAAAWKRQGVELVSGDVHDSSAVHELFRNTEGAFAMSPPHYSSDSPMEEGERVVTAVVEAAHEAGLPRLLILSSVGAERESGTGVIRTTHVLERETFKLGLPVTAIRAASFMENLAGMVPAARATGKLPTMFDPLDKQMAMVATDDIGALAAELLTDSVGGKRVVELEGPREYSARDAAAILGDILGKAVTAETVPHEHWMRIYESFGMSPSAANGMVEMMDGFNAGRITFGKPGAAHRKGKTELKSVLAAVANRG